MTRVNGHTDANSHNDPGAAPEIVSELNDIDLVEGRQHFTKPPTKTYQAMLLLAGSMMIFHVIGINQVFGIFQVSSIVHSGSWDEVWLLPVIGSPSLTRESLYR